MPSEQMCAISFLNKSLILLIKRNAEGIEGHISMLERYMSI